jgi:hypothetical protein
MTPIPLNLATEDELSEVALLRLLDRLGRFAVGAAYRRGGFGYLRRTILGWNQAAKGIPFLVLADLDKHECPASLTFALRGHFPRSGQRFSLLSTAVLRKTAR